MAAKRKEAWFCRECTDRGIRTRVEKGDKLCADCLARLSAARTREEAAPASLDPSLPTSGKAEEQAGDAHHHANMIRMAALMVAIKGGEDTAANMLLGSYVSEAKAAGVLQDVIRELESLAPKDSTIGRSARVALELLRNSVFLAPSDQ